MSNNEEGLSEYELLRARNIERNNARLLALGLISQREEQASNACAFGRPQPQHDSDNDEEDEDEYADSPQAKRKRKSEPLSSPSRKSLRLQGLQPDGKESSLPESSSNDNKENAQARLQQERQNRVKECREARQRIAVQYASLGATKAAKENPTATYEHCLMRVRTMTEKALANRVKVIERAAGKHCVVKMAIFKSCLQDEAQWELAELASAALERLKALKPPPESD